MKRYTVLIWLVLITLSPRVGSAEPGQPVNGLWVEARLVEMAPAEGVGMSIFGTRLPIQSTPVVSPFAAGYKLDRLLIGAGLNVVRTSLGKEDRNGEDREVKTVFWLNPGASYALFETEDRTANLYARGGIHLSWGALDDKPASGGGRDEDIVGFGGDAAVGIRAYLTAFMAVGAELGSAYSWFKIDPEGPDNTERASAFGFFGGLTLLGVLPM